MKVTNLLMALVAVCAAGNAGATTLYLDSVDGVKDSSGNLVGPYYGRIDTTPYLIFCDDFDHEIGVPDSEQVNISTINNLSLTRYGGVANAANLYKQVFYLAGILSTASTADRGDIQDAMWSYFSSNAPNQNSAAVKGWETLAANNYQGKDYSSFRIATDSTNQFGGKQEEIINTTPEPGTWALLLTGLGGFVVARTRRKA